MANKSSMVHVRIEDELKDSASTVLAGCGLTIADAVRILLTQVVKEGGLPVGLGSDPKSYDAWFHAKVKEAQDDTRERIPHAQAMAQIRSNLDRHTETA